MFSSHTTFFVQARSSSALSLRYVCTLHTSLVHFTTKQPSQGFKLVALKLDSPTREHVEKHYADLSSKGFFGSLVDYMMSGPVVCMVWQGTNVVAMGRTLLGATNPADSAPGTIRGDLCVEVGRNVCHGSDAVESAQAEIALWFPEGVKEWNSCQEQWVSEA